jgi:hypothetical protein
MDNVQKCDNYINIPSDTAVNFQKTIRCFIHVDRRTLPLPSTNLRSFQLNIWPLRLPLCSSGQSSWLQIQRSGFDSRRYQIFWAVGLERGPLSLVSTTEALLERKSSCSGLEIREYGRRDPSSWPRGTLYPQKLELTSPTSGGRSVGIVRSRTQATEFLVFRCLDYTVSNGIIIAEWSTGEGFNGRVVCQYYSSIFFQGLANQDKP